jgi:hypothetical protein
MSEFKASTRPSGVWASDPTPTPATAPTSPTDLTIPGNGRAEPSDNTPFEAPPLRVTPGRRAGMTVWAGSGEVEHHFSTPQAPTATPSSSGPIRPVFQTSSGRPVMAKDVTPETLVVDPTTGEVSSSLGALLNANLIREGKDGWELADSRGRFHEPTAKTTREQDQAGGDKSDATDQQDTPAPVEREYLAHADEAMLRETETKIGAQLFANVERALISAEATEVPESIITSVAAKLGVDRDGALAAIAQHAQPYITQATQTIAAAVGEAGAAEALEWARQHAKHELADAMRRQIDSRDLDGYRTIGKMWLMAEARRDPHRVAAGLVAAGTRARVAGKEVIVDLGKAGGGETSFAAALRGNVVQLGKSRRGPRRRS